MRLSENFYRSEFKCKCGQCDYDTVDAELIEVLQMLRDKFKASIKVTSGNRCPAHNKSIGGSEKSYHIRGRAADIQIQGVEPKEVQEHLKLMYMDMYGIGSYSTFTHIDTRTKAGRW